MALSFSLGQKIQSARVRLAHAKVTTLLVLVVLLALGLRLWGLDFGLPYVYDPDEDDFIRPALLMLAERSPNPGYFQHPGSTTIYMLSVTYALIFGVGFVLGVFDSPEMFENMLNQDPSLVFLAGRLEVALFGVATVVCVYFIGRRLANPYVGLLAALGTAISPLHVWISHLIRTDVMMGFFVLVTVWFCLRITETSSWRHSVLAGIFAGLAVVTKYPAVVVVLTIVTAHLLSPGNGRNRFVRLVESGVATVVAAFVASPFLFLDWQETLRDVSIEMRSEHVSSTGEGFLRNLFWYISEPMANDFTVIGLVIIAFGLATCLTFRNPRKLLVCVFPLALLLFISNLGLRHMRWLVPLVPFAALFFAFGVQQIVTQLARQPRPRTVITLGAVVPALVVAAIAYNVALQGIALAGTHTRTLAREWMLANIPEGSRILVEAYTPQLPKDYYAFYHVVEKRVERHDPDVTRGDTFRPGGVIGFLENRDELSEYCIEYFVIGWFYERYGQEKESYPEVMVGYEQVIEIGDLVFEVQPNPRQPNGFPVRIYQLDGCNQEL